MTTQLPERLRALAEDAPEALSAGDLWHTGTRRHRLRRAAVMGTAACLVLVTAWLGSGVWHSRQPAPTAPPATTTGRMAVPERFFHPSPWLSGTSAPGRLFAILGTTREHFPFGQDLNALVGVTAGSQAYHFLDLPGQGSDTDVALSPDGRHVAYWVNGQPSKATRVGDRSIVGVAILDLTTGEVERHVVPTDHGLSAGALVWTDDRTLAMAAAPFTSAAANSYFGGMQVRLVRVGRSTSLLLPHSNVLPVPVATTSGYAGMVGNRVLRTYDDAGRVTATVHTSSPLRGVAYDAASGRLAGIGAPIDASGPTSRPLMFGRVLHGDAHLSEVPGGRSYLYALGWADARHVVAEQLLATGEKVWVVDVHTGARTPLTSTGYQATGSSWYAVVVLAADALRHPTTVAAVAPPHPWNPRSVAGVLAALLLAASGVLVLVLRSRRVRR